MLPFTLADLVDRHDAGMIEGGRRFGLGVEPLHFFGGGELAGQDHLQRHDAAELHLPRLVHHAHAAAGDLGEDLVVAEAAPHKGGQGDGQ